MDEDYIEINRRSWNNRVEAHLKSDFYDLKGFLKGKSSLNTIELDRLGDLHGKSVLHLQCHFGQDSLSLGRLGAKVTGVDLSDKAIRKAKELADETGMAAEFICCSLYDLPQHMDRQFDLVFTSYGTIGWLPDLAKWGQLVSRYLKPEGKFLLVEFHPFVWMIDDNFEKISYHYFNVEAIAETETGTYADKKAPISLAYVCWNHSLSEVVNSLITSGLTITALDEFDYSPYNCFNKTIEVEPKKYRIAHLGNKIPMVFALQARKIILD